MTSKTASKLRSLPVDALSRDLMPETRAVLSELTSLIRRAVPEATEKVRLGWRSVNFSHPDVGYFCGLFPREDRVVMEFPFGVLLPDPSGILIGNSCAKQVRFARFRSANVLPRTGLKSLFRAAVSLPPDRSARIALVKSGATPVVPRPRPKQRTPP